MLDWIQAFYSTRIRDGTMERVEGAISLVEGRGGGVVEGGRHESHHVFSLTISVAYFLKSDLGWKKTKNGADVIKMTCIMNE